MKKSIFSKLPDYMTADGKWVSSIEGITTCKHNFKEAFPYGIAISSKGLEKLKKLGK